MGRFAQELEPFLRTIRGSIWSFCDAMNYAPTWQQAEALAVVQLENSLPYSYRKKRLAVKSGKGPGKTTVTIIIALWRLIQDVDSLCVLTAPTMRQCRDVWLAEARRLIGEADPILRKMFDVLGTRIEICGRRDWGVWTATSTRPENLQGYHQKHLTFLGDEASGIERPIVDQMKSTLSNDDSLLVLIGNPNTRDCAFFDCFSRDRERWHTLTWNAEDAALDERHPDHAGIANRNKLLEIEYGRDSDVYRISVLGEFPHSDPNCIISIEDLEACTRTGMVARSKVLNVLQANKAFGYDFARFGGDESVVYRRSGLAVVEWKAYSHVEPQSIVDVGFVMQKDATWPNKDCWHVADAGGMGQGVMSSFIDAKKQLYEFHSGARSSDAQFADQITEAWFNVRALARRHLIHIPDDNRLLQQLSTRQYFTRKKDGKIIIEPKDDYKDRGHDSPDRADALVLAFYDRMLTGCRIDSTSGGQRRVGSRIRGSR